MSSRRLGASAIAAFAATALALGAAFSLGPTGSARAAPAPIFTLDFTGLTPGVPVTETGAFTLDRDATLASFVWLERIGVMNFVDLTVEVCDSAGTCVDPLVGAGTAFAAGVSTVTVTAVLTGQAGNGETGSIVGQLAFVADDELAATGAQLAPWLASAAAVIALGALILAGVRRRSGDESERAP